MMTRDEINAFAHACPVVQREADYCPLLGQCLKHRLTDTDQLKLGKMLGAMERDHKGYDLLVKIGRLVKSLKSKKGPGNG